MKDFFNNSGRLINDISVCNASCLFLSNVRKPKEKTLIYTIWPLELHEMKVMFAKNNYIIGPSEY